MGVPAFYKWLVGRYPKIVEDAKEEKECIVSSELNPNGKEFDNLYLDMNSIIHPCFHPEDQINGPTTYEEVFSLIFEHTDRLFNIVRPKKVLYMAIDGVTPIAKMNQQRRRRYFTARDAEIVEAEEARLREEFARNGKEVLPKDESELSDSNIITPGTVFMHKLAIALENYIRDRIANDSRWKYIKVILSDSNVPGEGEHKIISYIRLQSRSPGYNPTTCHCIYGLDADIIMLALATHEINFYILREDILKHAHDDVSNAVSEACSKLLKTGIDAIKSKQSIPELSIMKKPYQFVNIGTLRQYLKIDMISDATVEVDVDRIVDDFIFICFFTGNDFLPSMPTLNAYEGALDLLIHVYKNIFSANGYLIDTSKINENVASYMNIKRVENFIQEVGTYEEKIFQKRYNLKQARIRRSMREAEKEQNEVNDIGKPEDSEHINLHCDNLENNFSVSCATTAISEEEKLADVIANTNALKQQLRDIIWHKNRSFFTDKIQFECDGWKAWYYKEKFSADNEIKAEFRRKEVVEKYMEGLCWTLHYYFSGVCSWSWYYPFYCCPFASDLKGLSFPASTFKIGEPFTPFNQLMAVLPPRSSNALPKAYVNLMMSKDSPLVEFYPKDFEVDADGKRYLWQGVCKLPFIDEEKLLAATKNVEKDLEMDEVIRNSTSTEKAFVRHFTGIKIVSVQEMLHDIDPKPIMTDDSKLPQMNITEDDIVKRCLWHEHHKVSTFLCPKSYHTVTAKYIARNDSQPQAIHVGAGSGWGGRGKGRINQYVSSRVNLQDQNRFRDNWRLNSIGRGGRNSDLSANQRYGNLAYTKNRHSSERGSGDRW